MHAMYLMFVVLLVLAIAYRYYSAFLAAKVLVLDDTRVTPAHRLNDGHNYHPTNKWVLFGHHFAAISGAGPLLGPVLAAQFGYMPGLLWILVGVCLAGAVQDFVILVLSVRRDGKSLAQLARDELGKIPGSAATIGILFVLVIALAGLGKAVVKALGGDVVPFKSGTEFIEHGSTIRPRPLDGLPPGTAYRIPPGTRIVYPPDAAGKRGEITVNSEFELEVFPKPDVVAAQNSEYIFGGLKLNDNITAVRRIPGSRWGIFSIALTIPIALFTGWWMYYARKGKVLEASIIGGVLTLGAVWLGAFVAPGESLANIGAQCDLSEGSVAVALAVYGFIASVLPVWVLLCPRDYLSSFLKIGTVLLLVVGVIVANPMLNAPAFNTANFAGGPTVKGHIFPFLFITIMCGAISGFHALVSSGTTPKMVSKESETRRIGYGAMLIEGLVGIVALIAAAALPQSHYYQMNTSSRDLPTFAAATEKLAKADKEAQRESMGSVEKKVGESLQGRTGGAVTLAVGIAEIFDGAARNVLGEPPAGAEPAPPTRPSFIENVDTGAKTTLEKLEGMVKYWYHFAIMFEALFILTTIDTGTRVGRFLLQETLGKWVHPKFSQTNWWPGAIISTLMIVGGWYYFIGISSNSFDAIWAMFGVSNQMLAVWALAVASVALTRSGKGRYLWVTFVPMIFVAITTTTAAVVLMGKFIDRARGDLLNASISISLLAIILICTILILGGTFLKLGEARRTVRIEPSG